MRAEIRSSCVLSGLLSIIGAVAAESPSASRPVKEPPGRDDRGIQRTVADFKRSVTGSQNSERGSAAPSGQAQGRVTIQEPITDTSAIGSSVLAPDGGSTRLGGINTQGEGRRTSGASPVRNSSYGRSANGSQTTVHVRIIDFKEEEERLKANSGR